MTDQDNLVEELSLCYLGNRPNTVNNVECLNKNNSFCDNLPCSNLPLSTVNKSVPRSSAIHNQNIKPLLLTIVNYHSLLCVNFNFITAVGPR